MHSFINNINLAITTFCQMKCPNCCCAVPWRPHKHFDWPYFEHAAKYLHGVERIHVTGGEPTLHPEFPRIAREFRALFGCQKLTIETNGFGLDTPENFAAFDNVMITWYPKDHYPGYPGNEPAIKRFIDHWKGHSKPEIIAGHVPHVDRNRRGTKSCARGSTGTISYWDGLLYPCCVAAGVDGGRGIPLTANWRTEINSVAPPCGNCWFAGE